MYRGINMDNLNDVCKEVIEILANCEDEIL